MRKEKEARRLRTEDPDVLAYVSKLRADHAYTGSPQDARKAVNEAMGAGNLTELLYESRRERSV